MAFIFIPMELFKIQGFFMQEDRHIILYMPSQSHVPAHFLEENQKCWVFVESEVIVYSVVNDVTMDTM